MRMSIITAALALVCSLGCEGKSGPKMEPDRPAIEINAPGVEVKVDPKEGVDVKAPGIEVEAAPKEGAEVKVDAESPK